MSARDRFSRNYRYQHYESKKSIEILRSDRNSFNDTRPEGPYSDSLVSKSYRQSKDALDLKEGQLVRKKRSGYKNYYFDSQPTEKLANLKEKARGSHNDWSFRKRNRMYEDNLPNKTDPISCEEFFPNSKGNCSGGSGYQRSCSLQKNIHTGTHDSEFVERKLYNVESSRFQNPILIKHCNDLPSRFSPSQRLVTGHDARFNSKETDKYEEYFSNNAGSNGNSKEHLDSVELTKSDSRNYSSEIGQENSLQERCEGSRFQKPTVIKYCNDLPSQYRPSPRLETDDDSWFNSKETDKHEEYFPSHEGSYGNSNKHLDSVDFKKSNSRNYSSEIGQENCLQYQERYESSRFENPISFKHCFDLPSQYRSSRRSETADDSQFNLKETDEYKEYFSNHAGSYGNSKEYLDSFELKKSNSRNYSSEISQENSPQYQERFEGSRFQNPIVIEYCNDIPSQYRPSRRLETGGDSQFNSRETDKYEEYFPNHEGSYGNSNKYLGSVELKKPNSRNYGSEMGQESSLQYQERRFQNPILIKHCNDLPSQYRPSRRLETGDDSRFNSKETDKYEEYFPDHAGSYGNSKEHLDSVELEKSNSRNYSPEIGLVNSLQNQERCLLRSSECNSGQLPHEEMDRSRLKSDNQESPYCLTENQRNEEYLADHQPGVFRPSDKHVYERRVIYKSHSDLGSPHPLTGAMMSDKRYSSAESTAGIGSEKFKQNTRIHHGKCRPIQNSFLDESNLLKNWPYESSNVHPYGAVTRNSVDDLKNNLHERTKDNSGMYSRGSKQFEHDKEEKWSQGNYEMFSLKTNTDSNRNHERGLSFSKKVPADNLYGSCQNDIENQAIGRGVISYKGESDEEEKVPLPKVNLVAPPVAILNKFKFYPPSAEEMEEIFKGLVIYFPFKINITPEKSAIVSITESFKESSQFDNLQVEDSYHYEYTHLRYSTIRWHGMMLARGLSETEDCSGLSEMKTCSESRNIAAMELINKLAQTCYSLKEKSEYFHSDNIQKLVKVKKIPGIFRLVRDEEAPNLEAASRFIEQFFKDNNDCELMFHCHERMLIGLERYVRCKGYHVRCNKPYLFVSVRRTPEYWCDKMLARGLLEDYRYQLIPPQGFRNDIFQNSKIKLPVQETKKKSKVHPLLWESLQAKLYGQRVEDHLIPLVNLVTHGFRVKQQQLQEKHEQSWKQLRRRVKRIAKKQKKKTQTPTQIEAPNQELVNTQTQIQWPNQGHLQSQKQMHNQSVMRKPSNIQLPTGVKKPIFKNKRESARMRRKYYQISRAMGREKKLSQTKTFKKMDKDTKK